MAPSHHTRPCSLRLNCVSSAAISLCARALNSPSRALIAAALSVRPCTNLREPARECRDIALGFVEPRDMAGKPVFRQPTLRSHEMAIDLLDEVRVFFDRQFAKIGKLARFPKELDRCGRLRHRRDLFV